MCESPSRSPLCRVHLLGEFAVEWLVPALDAEIWQSRRSALALFKLLLCAPNRQALRSQLAGILWPETDEDKALTSVRSALQTLRKVLRVHNGERLLENALAGEALKLAGQEQLWLDIDAFEALVEAGCQESDASQALRVLQQARHLLRGEFLVTDQGQEWCGSTWVKLRRKRLLSARRRMIQQVSGRWIELGQRAEAEAVLAEHVQRFPADQDALYRLLKLLIEEERFAEAEEYYEQGRLALVGIGRKPVAALQELRQHLHIQATPISLEPEKTRASAILRQAAHNGDLTQAEGTTGLAERIVPLGDEQALQKVLLPLFSSAVKQGILQAASELEGDNMNQLRRQLVGQALTGTAALLPSYTTAPHPDILERLAKVLTGPSHVDDITLRYLEKHTANYWQDRHQAIIASPDLLGYVLEHLEKIIALLEQSFLPQERLRLCSLASQTAQLAGHLLFDLSAYRQARRFHITAIRAAQEAGDTALEGAAWARMSFTWTYSGHAKEALSCIHRASALASGKINATALAYLAAVEAEVQAILGEQRACLDKLNEAESLLRASRPEENTCWLRFDHSRLAGYQGICFQRLYRREDPQTASFLMHAQTALQDALERLSPALIQRRPALLIDLAGTYTRQGEIEGACKQVIQAFEVIELTKSQAVIQRLLQLRQALEPWKQTAYVKQVDERMEALLVPNSLPQGIQER